MAAGNIGTDQTHHYPLAKMPALTDAADIQIALRNYHYGQDTPIATGVAPTAGIAYYLKQIEASIAEISTDTSAVVLESVMDAKGDLFVGSGNNALDNLSIPGGSNGYLLTADTAETLGVKWAPPAVTAATTSVVGSVQLSDSISETSSVKAATPTAVKTVAESTSALNFTILEKTADHTLVLSDGYKIIEMNLTSTANTVTIPTNSTQAFATGSQITIIQTGTGATTVTVSAGVTLNCTPQISSNAAKLRAQYSSCTLIKRATKTWIAIGDLSA
jgi:hypothetical protein